MKGTEPYDECPIHTGTGLLTRLGGLFGGGSGPAPVAESASPLPEHDVPAPAATATAEASAAPEARAEKGDEPKKKRGFWGRIFGSKKNPPAADRPDGERPRAIRS